MPMYFYRPESGRLYAQSFALYDSIPEDQRLFYYGAGQDCTNFISQCVWAAYGGWQPGFSPDAVKENESRILKDYMQVSGVWYGSKRNIGSTKWCRVEEFYHYVTGQKDSGPRADKIAEGTFDTVDPAVIKTGDVIQMVVTDYTPDRYGHGLYVTQGGQSYDDIFICCHTDDRLNERLSWFAAQPEIYAKLRVLRFREAVFS